MDREKNAAQDNTPELPPLVQKASRLLAERISEIAEARSFLRSRLKEQIAEQETLTEESRTEMEAMLGDYGTEEDTDRCLQKVFFEYFPKFLAQLYSELCAGDERLHRCFWKLGDEALIPISRVLNGPGQPRHIARLASSLKDYLFTFEDIPRLPDRAVQIVLREVDQHELATALQSDTGKVTEKITRNMSQRATAMLLEDIRLVKAQMSDKTATHKARCKILHVISRLMDSGLLNIPLLNPEEVF